VYIHNLPNAHAKFRLSGPFDSLVKTITPNAKEFFARPPYFNFHATELHIISKVFFHTSFRILKVSGASVAAVGLLLFRVGSEKLRL